MKLMPKREALSPPENAYAPTGFCFRIPTNPPAVAPNTPMCVVMVVYVYDKGDDQLSQSCLLRITGQANDRFHYPCFSCCQFTGDGCALEQVLADVLVLSIPCIHLECPVPAVENEVEIKEISTSLGDLCPIFFHPSESHFLYLTARDKIAGSKRVSIFLFPFLFFSLFRAFHFYSTSGNSFPRTMQRK